jgi:DNA repair exonuclease SbcCD ATPase subunit
MELFNVMNEMGKELDTARTRIADLERQLAAAQERERVLREMYERAALTPPPAEDWSGRKCPACKGSGEKNGTRCNACAGTGDEYALPCPDLP